MSVGENEYQVVRADRDRLLKVNEALAQRNLELERMLADTGPSGYDRAIRDATGVLERLKARSDWSMEELEAGLASLRGPRL